MTESRIFTRGIALFAAALALFFVPFAAAQEFETLTLRYRTAEQVLPVLRPLAEPGGVVTGMQSTLVVRGTRRQIDQIKQALVALDAPPRRLLIQVRQDASAVTDARGGGISSGPGGVGARVYSSRDANDASIAQQVQTLDGHPATIMIGRSVPIVTQSVTRSVFGSGVTETVTYRDVATGFVVVPRVAGEQVTLELAPQMQFGTTSGTLGSPPQVSSQQIVTAVSGRLGEWIEVGGAATEAERASGRILSSNQAATRDDRRVWVRVQEVQ